MNGFLNMLFNWYLENARDFPFRRTRDPYLIWISEIIMQQTRIEQGVPYYKRFVNTFPGIHDLAGASEEDVLKQWQGLGYYTRARNLYITANEVVEKYAGRFPETYEGLRSLKGIGDYTAAAIASVCFGLPHPVMDGNVIRFITRHFGITGLVDKAGVKKEIIDVLLSLMEEVSGVRVGSIAEEPLSTPDNKDFATSTLPGLFNQAMIEFGATYCLPRNPDCNKCIFTAGCYALKHGMVNELPLKKQQQALKTRYFHYLVIHVKGRQGIYFRKRTGNDIWKGLYEFPMLETSGPDSLQGLMNSPAWKQYFGKTPIKLLSQTAPANHLLSHQKITASFCSLEIEKPSAKCGMFIRPNKIHELPVARILEKYLEDHAISEL
jgi:A/G-specific adenine glycosylase